MGTRLRDISFGFLVIVSTIGEFDLDLLQSDSCVNSSFKTITLSWIELVVLLRACARYLRINHFADKRRFQCDIVLFEFLY